METPVLTTAHAAPDGVLRLASEGASSPNTSKGAPFLDGACYGSVVLDQLRSDTLYREFLEDNFDAKAVAAKAVQDLAITDNLAKISAGISQIDREIRREVGEKYDELLCHATDIEGLEKNLQETFASIKTLKVISDRLQSRMSECFDKVEQQTLMLSRLYETCELARTVGRLAGVCRQLRQTNSKQNKDMIKSAQLISEVDYLLANVGENISSVDAIRSHVTFLNQYKDDLVRQCQALLGSALEAQNTGQVAIVLQSFHNMGLLGHQLDILLEAQTEKAYRATRNALDAHKLSQMDSSHAALTVSRTPGRANLGGGGGAAFRGNLWASIENLVASIGVQLNQIVVLEQVMAKRKDSNSHVTFLEILSQQNSKNHNAVDVEGQVESSASLPGRLWRSLSKMLSRELNQASQQSTFVRQAFEGEYPKLIKIFTTKLEGINLSELSLESLETAYLSRSLSRLLDCINLCLANTPPAQDDVVAIVNVIISEIRVTESVGDVQLLRKVSRNVAQTVAVLASRSEETVIRASVPDAVQVIGPATTIQKHNGLALQLLQLFSTQLSSFLDSVTCDSVAVSIMSSSLKHIDSTFTSALSPLMGSIGAAIEAIFLTMHNEKYNIPLSGTNSAKKDSQCSLYMRELTGFMQRVFAEYICLFPQSKIVQDITREMGCRAIELFLRFVSLLRPVSDEGCLRLAADCAQLEIVMAPLLRSVDEEAKRQQQQDALGRQISVLRALRPLLLQPSEQISKASSVGSVVPYTTVLHFLFSRAPQELKSPHEAASWSLQRYSQWLDQHPSEKDRLVLIRGALDAYLRWVRQNGVKEFPPIYVVINELLAKAVSDCI